MAAAAMDNQRYYTLLEVQSTCSAIEIKKSYKKLAMKYHPDKNPDNPMQAEAKFKEISEAYGVLSDENKRKMYDAHGEAGLKEGGSGGNPHDVFAHMFGAGGFPFGNMSGQGVKTQKMRKTPDIKQAVPLTQQEFYCGCVKQVPVKRETLCTSCKGKGTLKKGVEVKCQVCAGQGVKLVMRQIGPGMIQQSHMACDSCTGSGEVLKTADACKTCKGKKTFSSSETLSVEVPRGKLPQSGVRIYNRANEAAGVETGDFVAVIVLAENDEKPGANNPVSYSIPSGAVADPTKLQRPHFEYLNTGVDLVMRVSISLQEALFGFRLGFRHLDDRVILVESAAFEVLQNECILMIENEGMPLENNQRERGDLLIMVTVVMPTSRDIRTMSEEHVAQIKSILPARVHDDSGAEELIGKHLKSALDNEEYEVQFVRTSAYDKESHMDKRRRSQQQRSSHSNAVAEDEDFDQVPSGQQHGAAGCKQM